MAPNRTSMTWPVSPSGQAAFVRDVRDVVGRVPDAHGAGVIWWYPESIVVPGIFIWGGGSLALFDPSGNVLPAASEIDAR